MRRSVGKLAPPAALSARVVRAPSRSPTVTQSSQRKAAPKKRKSARPTTVRNAAPPPPLLFVVLVGLTGEVLRRRCVAVAEQARGRGSDAVFLIDDASAFSHLRWNSLVFEYLPPPKDRALISSGLQWDLYLRRRARLLYEKWRPASIVAIGPAARRFAALMPQTPAQTRPKPPSRIVPRLKRWFQ